MPKTPPETEWISRATQPVKAAEEGKAVIQYICKKQYLNPQLDISCLISRLVLSQEDRPDSGLCIQHTSINRNCHVFFLIFLIPQPPHAHIMPPMPSALGEILRTSSPSLLVLKTLLERQLDCLKAQKNIFFSQGRRLNLVIQRGCHPKTQLFFLVFFLFLSPMHLKCNHHMYRALLQ